MSLCCILTPDHTSVLVVQLDSAAIRGQYRWWEEAELKDLCTGVGLQASHPLHAWISFHILIKKIRAF